MTTCTLTTGNRNSKIDFASIKQNCIPHLRQILPSLIPGGVFRGDDYVVCSPFREDKTPGSFMVSLIDGYAKDFALPGEKRIDIIELYSRIRNVSQIEAAQALADMSGTLLPAPATPSGPALTRVTPVPDCAPPPPNERSLPDRANPGQWLKYPLTHSWAYRDTTGHVLGYVTRYTVPPVSPGDKPGKETPPLTLWCTDSGALKWKFKGFPKPTPIYNLNLIAANSTAGIILVEGEKKAEALQNLFQSAGLTAAIATCWIGGANAIRTVDFSLLAGRSCILWPDNDSPGRTCMQAVAEILQGLNCKLQLISIPDGHPPKWDAADAILDEGWDFTKVWGFIRENARAITPVPRQPSTHQITTDPAPTAETPITTKPTTKSNPEGFPFRLCGHKNDYYYYISNSGGELKSIKGSNHSKSELLTLAPLSYWERSEFQGTNGVNWTAAHDRLIVRSHERGIFNVSSVRGRGAWFDNGKIILHLGDHLLINGKQTCIREFETDYIYNQQERIEFSNTAALNKSESNKLREICDMLFWEKPINSVLLSGWLAIAPICGAMKYRPHIWITGESNSGKSFVVDNIIKKTLGNFSLHAQSSTTEAGIRQSLQSDAIPVLVDEFEAEDFAAQERVQKIIELSRQAFTDTGAKILKGGQQGKPQEYHIRSCFLMTSINVSLSMRADKRRVCVLSLLPAQDGDMLTKEEHFAILEKMVYGTITDNWAAGFRARSYSMIPIIRKNTEIFTAAIAHKLGNRGSGDQLGPLLAGSYSIGSDKEITPAAAAAWVDTQDWQEARELIQDKDQSNCLTTITSEVIEVKTGLRLSIFEVIQAAISAQQAPDPMANLQVGNIELNDAALRRHGIKISFDEGIVFIHSGHPLIKKSLSNTPWKIGAGGILKRIEGAIYRTVSINGTKANAVGIPIEQIIIPEVGV